MSKVIVILFILATFASTPTMAQPNTCPERKNIRFTSTLLSWVYNKPDRIICWYDLPVNPLVPASDVCRAIAPRRVVLKARFPQGKYLLCHWSKNATANPQPFRGF